MIKEVPTDNTSLIIWIIVTLITQQVGTLWFLLREKKHSERRLIDLLAERRISHENLIGLLGELKSFLAINQTFLTIAQRAISESIGTEGQRSLDKFIKDEMRHVEPNKGT